jgi:hypothetical protein
VCFRNQPANLNPSYPHSRLARTADLPNLVERVECGEFGDRLGPFPAAETVHWPLLVQYITPDTLRCAGLSLGAPTVADDDTATGYTPNGQMVPYFPDVARTARYAPVRNRRVDGMTTEQVRTATSH